MLPLYLMLLFYFLADIDSGIQTNARVLVSESSRQTHHAAGQENSRQNDRVAGENRSAYREMKNEETADKNKTSSQPAPPQEGNSIHSSFMRKSVIRNIICARNARGCVVDPHTGHYVCFVSFCGWRHYYVTSACERQTSRRLVCFILRLYDAQCAGPPAKKPPVCYAAIYLKSSG